MIGLWCQDQHAQAATPGQPQFGARFRADPDPRALCDDCAELLRYGQQRLANCVFGECKRPCAECASDCYSETMRPRMLEIIRYAEPRLLARHPLLGLRHRLDQWLGRLRRGRGPS